MPIGAFRLNTVSKLIAEATVIYARTAKTVTANGNAQVSTAQSKFGGSSALFDGTLDYLICTPAIAFSTGDFTIECWIRPSVVTGIQVIYDDRNLSSDTSKILFYMNGTSIYYYSTGNHITGTISTANTWYHVAVSRSSNTVKMFINGIQAGSNYTDTGNKSINSNNDFLIGQNSESRTADHDFNGYIDEFRISDTARYTSSFTPLSIPFVNDNNTKLLIHADGANASTTFTDDNVRHRRLVNLFGDAQVSTAQSKFGGASVLLDGTTDYIGINSNSSLTFTGDFTIEMFYRATATNGALIPLYNTSDHLFYIGYDGGNPVYTVFSGGSNRTTLNAITGWSLNTWYHVAFVRSGSTITIYHNGVANTTGTWANTVTTGSPNTIGSYASYYHSGYVDEIRVSNIARYTTTFTPSTTPFEPDANTLLLIHGDGTTLGTQVYNDVYAPPAVGHQSLSVIPYGNAQISTAQSKFGNSSYLGDGTGDYIAAPSIPLGSGDWTIEFWFRVTSMPPTDCNLFDQRAGNDSAPYIRLLNNGSVGFGYGYNEQILTASSAFTTGTWYHLAVCKSGSSTKMFKDGTQVGSTYTDSRTYTSPAITTFGQYNPAYFAGGYALNGHMDEVRVSNTARYTANFTAATTPFQSDANTLVLLHCDGENNSTRFVDDGSNPAVLDDVVIHATNTSTASTITIPAAAATGDYAILFDTSTTTTDTIPSGWTSINKATTTGIRTNISYKKLLSSDPNTSVTGMAGTTRKVMLIIKGNSDLLSNTLSTPGSQATTAVPTNQTISTSNVNTPAVFFAVYASTGAITTRGWSGGSPTEYSSFSTSGIYVKALVYGRGTTPATATISMSDGGTNTLQSFSMKFA